MPLLRRKELASDWAARAHEMLVFGIHGFWTNIPGGLKSEINVYSRAGNMCTRPQEGQTAPREACSSAHLPGAKKVKYENLLSPGCFPFHREEPGGRALLTLTVALGLGLLLQGCGTSPRGPAVPTAFETKATVIGLPYDIRYFPRDPENIKLIEKEFEDSWSRERQYLREPGHAG